jgi:hypothetical protein
MLMSRLAVRDIAMGVSNGQILVAGLEPDGVAMLTKLARQRIDGRRVLIQVAS